MIPVTRAEVEAKAATLPAVGRLRIWVEFCRTPHVWRALPQTARPFHAFQRMEWADNLRRRSAGAK